jgi:hypothetical protein
VVYLDINLAKVAMWLYGYLPGYIDIQIISPTYLDIDIRARISVDIDIRRSGKSEGCFAKESGTDPYPVRWLEVW